MEPSGKNGPSQPGRSKRRRSGSGSTTDVGGANACGGLYHDCCSQHEFQSTNFVFTRRGNCEKESGKMPDDISLQLLCPRCNVPLKKVQSTGRVFWRCDRCDGRAITLELLRRTFTAESINPLWLHAIRGEGTKAGPCPSCRNPMIDVELSENAKVDVDVCRICHMVWFDPHEM